ncbi:MAG: hypothetical protein KF799_03595 [Bdellovibrionales bacterium]|nr:hypothetical protein [Bdellovibrionales bacterium]
MKWILRLIFFLIGQRAKIEAMREAKRYGVIAYMRALQGTRRVLILALLAFLVLQLMLISLVGALVVGFQLWNEEPHFKMQVLFGVFATLFTLPALGLCVVFSERVWYKLSGAEKMVNDVQSRRGGNAA